MRAKRLIYFTLVAACMLMAVAAARFTLSYPTAHADEEATPTNTYTYTKEEEYVASDGVTHFRYYVDTVDGGFGSLTKAFVLPASYNIGAELKHDIIFEAIHQIIAKEEITTYNENYTGHLTIKIDGSIEETLVGRVYSDFGAPLTSYFEPVTLAAVDTYPITGRLSMMVYRDKISRAYFYFDVDPVTMSPIKDGDLIELHTQYVINHEDNDELAMIKVRSNGKVFSTDPEDPCYIVSHLADTNDDTEYGIPIRNISTLDYIVNRRALIGEQSGVFGRVPISDVPYLLQARLTFKTIDNEEVVLYTNEVTVRRHELEMRIDGTEDYRVGVDTEHEYSFIIDDNDYDDYVVEECSFTIDDPTLTSDFDTNTLKATLAFSDVGTREVGFSLFTLHRNNGKEKVTFLGRMYDVEVLEEEPAVIVPEYDITFNYPDDSAALLGGGNFEITASINEVYGDEHFSVQLTATGSAAGIMSAQPDSMILAPLSEGRVMFTCTAVSTTAGEFTEVMFVNVVKSTAANTLIIFDEDVSLSGSAVVARLTVGGFTSFINFSPSWTVTIEDGEALVAVPFTHDGRGAVTLPEAKRGYYHFAVSDDNISDVEALRHVTSVNMEELAREFLPYLAPIMLLCVVLVLVLRFIFNKRNTLLRRLTRTASVVDACIAAKESDFAYPAKLKKIMRELKRSLSLAGLRDQETLGQYQNVCNLLTLALQISAAAYKNHRKIRKTMKKKLLKTLKVQYVDESVRICAELDESLEKYANSKAVAATVAPTDKDKNGAPILLNKFYALGDIEDGGRSGESSRTADTKTEN